MKGISKSLYNWVSEVKLALSSVDDNFNDNVYLDEKREDDAVLLIGGSRENIKESRLELDFRFLIAKWN